MDMNQSTKKPRQNAENKQIFDLTRKIEIKGKKLVKTLKINKLLVFPNHFC